MPEENFVEPLCNAPDLVWPPVTEIAAAARPREEVIRYMTVVDLRRRRAACTSVPFGILSREPCSNCAVFIAAPAADRS